MTPTQRREIIRTAEKILEHFGCPMPSAEGHAHMPWLESLLREAMAEAYKEGKTVGCFDTTEEAFRIIKEEREKTYTRAAEVARMWPGEGGYIEMKSFEPNDVMNAMRQGIAAAIERLREGK